MRSTTSRQTRRLAVAALTAAVTLLAGACSNTSTMSGMPGMGANTPTTSSTAGTAAPATGAHNDADVMFAQMMIPHHRQAVEMSDMILAKSGIDHDVTALATKIKAAQAPEITMMSGWLAGWGEDPSPSAGGMGGMDHGGTGDGMMSQADMDKLKNASGNEAAKLFLNGMITHHKGAITMAESELANGQNAQAKTLAQSIVTSQSAEITTMTELLADVR
ncbi:uncharacterized protein (DUF305 family) [Friedmanniella endophytica]|uniref:Uncharacterized protein (DUF305 family) n=1 Tax=Microlunatus kandeliicorticis TaxID=1759536 RepID=A0A7W3IVP9_9ACTN|nr:uncharacterized protein (DUF305 family) [Microlunatus kandeliicorticis]